MREILFRGKGTHGFAKGKWVYGYYLKDFWGENRKGFGIHLIEGGYSEVDPETIGQYTGSLDKNGKKIFEGDVVKFTDSPFGYSYVGVVCFNEGSFCIKYEFLKKEKLHRIGQTDKWQDMGASGIVTYQYEVLGNIHDNPELPEEGENG